MYLQTAKNLGQRALTVILHAQEHATLWMQPAPLRLFGVADLSGLCHISDHALVCAFCKVFPSYLSIAWHAIMKGGS